MPKPTRRIKYPSNIPQFDPATDTPLRYFSVKETFVRSTRRDSYKLYCGQHMVLMIAYDGFLYAFPSYQSQYEPYAEAFIREYAPHISFSHLKPHLGTLHLDYIGKPMPVTL